MSDYIINASYLEILDALQHDARLFAEWRKANPDEAAKLDADAANLRTITITLRGSDKATSEAYACIVENISDGSPAEGTPDWHRLEIERLGTFKSRSIKLEGLRADTAEYLAESLEYYGDWGWCESLNFRIKPFRRWAEQLRKALRA